jgi:hypothetical protein
VIVPQCPPLFEEFRAKRFNLLWRGSRDGFGAKEFHHHCDGRANTLTLIVDTYGDVRLVHTCQVSFSRQGIRTVSRRGSWAEGGKEAGRNPVQFRMRSTIFR